MLDKYSSKMGEEEIHNWLMDGPGEREHSGAHMLNIIIMPVMNVEANHLRHMFE